MKYKDNLPEEYCDHLRQQAERILEKVSKFQDKLYDYRQYIKEWKEIDEDLDQIQVELNSLIDDLF